MSPNIRPAASCLVLLLTLNVAVANEPAKELAKENWLSWRGPLGSGSALGGSYAAKFGPEENLLWKVKLPGIGCSTPIVNGDQIIVTAPVDKQDAVLTFDWKGKRGWTAKIGKERPGRHRNGSGCNPSPASDGKSIFVYYKSGNLAGLGFDGKVHWKTNLQERFGRDTLYWDIGTSPVVTRDYCVATVMQQDGSYLAAFDKKTGDLKWKVDRNYECPVEGDHSYATPIVTENRGRELIIVWGAEHLTAHASKDGSIVWSCGGFNPEKKRNWVAVASAVLTGDTVVVPYGRGSRLAGVRLGGKGDVTKSHRLWTGKDNGAFVPTPAAQGGKVYVLRDRGEIICLDPKSGVATWKAELPRHRAKYYASPVLAGGKLFATREDGTVMVARVSGEFEVLAQNDMGERMIASPVPVNGKILLRGEKHLFCVRAPKG